MTDRVPAHGELTWIEVLPGLWTAVITDGRLGDPAFPKPKPAFSARRPEAA